MIARLRTWYSARRLGTKILIVAAAAIVVLSLLYIVPRSLQYAGAARTPAGLFVPEDADIVVRVSDLAGKWKEIQETEFWKGFTRRLQKDAAIRAALNDILGSSGAPTLDQLQDKRWLNRNPMMQESSILRYAGRDLALSTKGDKFCVATRVGLGDFLLLPALHLFPAAAGARRSEAGGASVLKRGELFIAIRGAIVVASNDASLLAGALKRRGKPEKTPGLLRASMQAKPLMSTLRGFPLGALLAVGDLETCRRIEVDVEISNADLVVRATAEGMKPRRPDPAPVDTLRMIPATGIGACFTNINAAPYWEWLRPFGDRRIRGGPPLDRIVRENLGEFIEVLQNQRFGEEVVPKLDGPISVLVGASQGGDGRTYAALALVLRSSQPREAADALDAIIARSMPKGEFTPMELEAGGISYRSYRFERDLLGANNYIALSYAVTSDALIFANNGGFLEEVLQCRANERISLPTQLHYGHAMRRLQELGMNNVLSTGAVESFFLYGPVIRQGLEGYYRPLASRMEGSIMKRAILRQELATEAAREGRPLDSDQLGKLVLSVEEDRTARTEQKLRSRARILDYLQWVAFQADAVNDGMKFQFALELKSN